MTIQSSDELAGLQRVGHLVARTLEQMRALVRPGITTAAIDDAAARFARVRDHPFLRSSDHPDLRT